MHWSKFFIPFLASQSAALKIPRSVIGDKRHFLQCPWADLAWLLHAVDVTDNASLEWLLKALLNSQWPYLSVYRSGQILSSENEKIASHLCKLAAAEPRGKVALTLIGNHCGFEGIVNELGSSQVWPFSHLPIFSSEFEVQSWEQAQLIKLFQTARTNPQLWLSMEWVSSLKMSLFEEHFMPEFLEFLSPEFLLKCSKADKLIAARLLFADSAVLKKISKSYQQDEFELEVRELLRDIRTITRFQFSVISTVGMDQDLAISNLALGFHFFFKALMAMIPNSSCDAFTAIIRAISAMIDLEVYLALKILDENEFLEPLKLSPNNRAIGTSMILELFTLALSQINTMDQELVELLQKQLAVMDFSLLIPVNFVNLLERLQSLGRMDLIRPYHTIILDNLPLLAAIAYSHIPIFEPVKLKLIVLALAFPGDILDVLPSDIKCKLNEKPTFEMIIHHCVEYLKNRKGWLDNLLQAFKDQGYLRYRDHQDLVEISYASVVLLVLRVPTPLDMRALASEGYLWNKFVSSWSLTYTGFSLLGSEPQELIAIFENPALMDELPDVRLVSHEPYDPSQDPQIRGRHASPNLTMTIKNKPSPFAGLWGFIRLLLNPDEELSPKPTNTLHYADT